jgi:cation diffusion facilitator CzcD-associated flavoprotein CzcO
MTWVRRITGYVIRCLSVSVFHGKHITGIAAYNSLRPTTISFQLKSMTSTTPEPVYNDVQLDDPSVVPIPKRVLIVGAGPAGLVSLRNLLERGQFDTVQIAERRTDIGGVWYVRRLLGYLSLISCCRNLEPDDTATSSTKPRWPSPAYKGLIGNVLPEFLSFSGRPFPPPPTADEGQPFPTLAETFAYLKSFAEPYLQSGLIRLNTEVALVEERPWGQGWRVVLRDWSNEGNGQEIEEIWDAVIVAVHWHDNPEWPDTPGLDQLRSLGLAKHAKEWRGPQGNENKVWMPRI